MKLKQYLPDAMMLMLFSMILLASFFPARGQFAAGIDQVSVGMIALLFFMHGARLSREAVIAGLFHWRLHLLVLSITFAVFPLLGIVLKPLLQPWLTPELYLGVMYLCVLPSTVQSSIAFTSVARGNVPAEIGRAHV